MGSGLSREFFQGDNTLRPNRPPLSGDEGLQALFRAEQIDQYQKQVSESAINRKARADYTYMPAVHSVKRTVPNKDDSQPWPSGQVVWMDPTAEGGLPHTRAPNYICIPYTYDEKQLANTLLHERVHVSQRLHPKAWEKLLAATWDMRPWVGNLPDSIRTRRRINPDLTPAPLFIWKNEYVVLGVFKDESKPVLAEIDLVWWMPKNQTLLKEAPPGWKEFFGTIPAGEHPYEISAYLVAAAPKGNKAYDALKSRLGDLPTGEV
jgi:hypothetical protein